MWSIWVRLFEKLEILNPHYSLGLSTFNIISSYPEVGRKGKKKEQGLKAMIKHGKTCFFTNMVFLRIAFWTPILTLQNDETAGNLMVWVSFIFRYWFFISLVGLYIFRIWGKNTKIKDSCFSVSLLFGSLAQYVSSAFIAQNSKSWFLSSLRLQKSLLVYLFSILVVAFCLDLPKPDYNPCGKTDLLRFDFLFLCEWS